MTNIGRAAVSVEHVALDLGPSSWRWWDRNTLRGRPVTVHGATADEVVRLKVGDSCAVLFDVWSTLRHPAAPDLGRITVRGTATPAGRRARRSPWRHRWQLPPSRRSLFLDTPDTPERAVYRSLWHSLCDLDGTSPEFLTAWIAARAVLESGNVSKESLGAAIGSRNALAAHDAWHAYLEADRRIDDSSSVRLPRANADTTAD